MTQASSGVQHHPLHHHQQQQQQLQQQQHHQLHPADYHHNHHHLQQQLNRFTNHPNNMADQVKINIRQDESTGNIGKQTTFRNKQHLAKGGRGIQYSTVQQRSIQPYFPSSSSSSSASLGSTTLFPVRPFPHPCFPFLLTSLPPSRLFPNQ